MGFGDQLARKMFQFVNGGQVQFGPTSPYVLNAADDQFLVCDPTTRTKCVRFDAGNVTAATTRVITLPDSSATFGTREVVTGTADVVLTVADSGKIYNGTKSSGNQTYTLPAPVSPY